jgi:hypothetical protein
MTEPAGDLRLAATHRAIGSDSHISDAGRTDSDDRVIDKITGAVPL